MLTLKSLPEMFVTIISFLLYLISVSFCFEGIYVKPQILMLDLILIINVVLTFVKTPLVVLFLH